MSPSEVPIEERAEAIHDMQTDLCDKFLAHMITVRARQVEVKSLHYAFLCFLIFKEIIVYFTCVRRAE